jgi:hypothetical protein
MGRRIDIVAFSFHGKPRFIIKGVILNNLCELSVLSGELTRGQEISG